MSGNGEVGRGDELMLVEGLKEVVFEGNEGGLVLPGFRPDDLENLARCQAAFPIDVQHMTGPVISQCYRYSCGIV
jgi:hypothetical protein